MDLIRNGPDLESDPEDDDYVPEPEAKPKAKRNTARKRPSGGLVLPDDDDDDDAADEDDANEGGDGDNSMPNENEDDAGNSEDRSDVAEPNDDELSDDADEADAIAAAALEQQSQENAARPALSSGAKVGRNRSVAARPSVESVDAAGERAAGNGADRDDADSADEEAPDAAADAGEASLPLKRRRPIDEAAVTTTAPQPQSEPAVASKPKSHIDALWAEMNAGVRSDTPTAVRKSRPHSAQNGKWSASSDDDALSGWLAQPARKVTSFKVPRLADLEADAAKRKEDDRLQRDQSASAKRKTTGLEDVLSVVRGTKSATVLDKTKESWQKFKTDAEVDDELENYKKDKSRYTDKVAFLARSDVREWEFEQKGKKGRR